MMDKAGNNLSLRFFLLLASTLFIPAYFINLGVVPCIEDEAIRGLVAFEMIQQDDFLTPTICGDIYLKKPPLFNWVLVGLFRLTGSYEDWVLRLPVIFSIILFAVTIFLFLRKEFGTREAMVNALVLVTSGRIIFYESLHGLIDITFSWMMYSLFLSAWYLHRRGKYLLLFLTAYAITGVAYLLKGPPSLIFLGITLLVLFISEKKSLMLLNWRHFAGMLVLVIIAGTYYVLYFMRNDVEPGQVLQVLVGEMTRRTGLRFGWVKTVIHLFTYPAEMLYHFMPWTFLLVLLFRKKSFRQVWHKPALRYMMLVFFFNIIPYWVSPESHPRYILMLVPLVITVLIHLYFIQEKESSRAFKVLQGIFGGVMVLAALAMLALMFHPSTRGLSYIRPVSVALFLILGTAAWLYFRQPLNRILWVAIALFVIRIGFDLSMVRFWGATFKESRSRTEATALARETGDRPLYSFWNPEFQPDDPYYGRLLMKYVYAFYLSREKGEVIKVTTERIPGALYIAHKDHIRDMPVLVHREIDIPGGQRRALVEFKEAVP
jgi:4-amino-4-deoxy-L-arabinose transferase-like glycosyltransferase